LPDPAAPAVTVTQVSLLVAVQEQAVNDVIPTLSEPAAAGTDPDVADSV